MKNEASYFIYARKSSEGADRQVLSIDGQLAELRKVIERDGLSVVDVYTESKSAHLPGNRPLFDDMIRKIRKGKANGIITWHTNRLSRNPKESGELQQMLQDGLIKSIVLPYREFRSDDNALLFSIETSEANQYSRDLSVNVKRGLYQKCEDGIPSVRAKLGYLNTKFGEHGTNYIKDDPERWHLTRKAFDMMLSKQYSVAQIAGRLAELGLTTRPTKTKPGKPVYKAMLYKVFSDPFYYGHFLYNGKLYPNKGSYKPMITAGEYDEVQYILGRKTRPRRKKHDFPLTGLMTCGYCGCAITGTEKRKLIKSTGSERSYLFYHCTKRRDAANCPQKHYTRSAVLESLVEDELAAVAVDPVFKEWAVRFLEKDRQQAAERQAALIKESREAEQKLVRELDALVEMRIAGHITEQQFVSKKEEKNAALIRLQEKTGQIESGDLDVADFIIQKLTYASSALHNFRNGDISLKKQVCMNFGRNWRLKDQKLFIDKPKWLEAITKFDKDTAAHFGRSEPEKTFTKYGEKVSWGVLSELMSALVNEVGTDFPLDHSGNRDLDNPNYIQ